MRGTNIQYMTNGMICCLIKKYNLSDECVKDYKKLQYDEWNQKYLNIIKKITKENILAFTDNAEEVYDNLQKVTIPNIEEKLMKQEWIYILEKLFEEIKPSETDKYDAIKVCDCLNEKYDLKVEIYNAVGYIDKIMRSNLVPNIKECENKNVDCRIYFSNENGKKMIIYQYYKYNKYINEDNSCLEIIKDNFSNNEISEIKKCIEFAKNQYIKSVQNKDISFDACFSFEELKSAKKIYDEKINEYEQNNQEEINIIEERNRIVEELTKPIELNILNHVKGAKCPNCGKETVKKISTPNRVTSIGLFGLFSSKLGKTMECDSCGYKW